MNRRLRLGARTQRMAACPTSRIDYFADRMSHGTNR